MKDYKAAVLYHNYYSKQGIDDVRKRITNIVDHDILLLGSVAEKNFLEGSIENGENEKFLKATNLGKDIGGKLLLIDLFMKQYAHIPFIVFLHDKKSYHKYSGGFEKERLFKILEPDIFSLALNKLKQDDNIGIIAPKECIKNEYDGSKKVFHTTNSDKLTQLQKEYSLFTNDYTFVAGTMFLIRTSIVCDFFRKYKPLKIRQTLESGNVLDDKFGTVTHSWERLLSWLATSKGYKIQGI